MKLKPCPICGTRPLAWWDNDAWEEGRTIECNSGQHQVRVYMTSGDVAEKIWNTRPIEDELSKRIAELEARLAEVEHAWMSGHECPESYTPTTANEWKYKWQL